MAEQGESAGKQGRSGPGSDAVSLTVVVVLDDRRRLQQLQQKLAGVEPPLTRILAIGEGEAALASVERLDPSADRRRRQRGMTRWLIPFGFVAGVTFTQITDLHTFDAVGSWGEPLIGGLLGLISGWMGSFAAAASVSSEEDDRIRSLRNRLEEGCWLLLLEPRPGADLPWTLLQQARPKAVVRLGET